jgi:hypothetical protein
MSQESLQRRSFFTRMNAGVASLAAMAGVAMAQEKAVSSAVSKWTPARHAEDDWLDQNQAKHRAVFDSINSDGLGEAMAFASNFYHANKSDYGIPESEVGVVIVVRHRSAVFGYNDTIWAKYGEHLALRAKVEDPKTKAAPKMNIYNSTGYGEQLNNRGVTLESLSKNGTQFAVCKLSTRAFAGVIAGKTGAKAEDVFAEISANLIPNARLVPAGIVAVNRAQERGYTLMSI